MAKAADALRAEALRLLQSGQMAAAEAMLRDLVKQRRNDLDALAMLGQVLAMRRAFDEALPLIQRAISGDRKRPDFLALSGETLNVCGRTEEALQRFEEALKLRPAYDAAIAGRTDALLRLGRYEDALTSAQAGPDTPVLAGIHARALRRSGDAAAARAMLERHLPADALPLEHHRTLWFELGHACDALKDHDAAAMALHKANDLSQQPGDEAQADTHLAALLEQFSATQWPSLPRSECDSDVPVYVVGLPRCGSTLVEQIIASHPQGAGAGELETLPELAGSLHTRVGGRLPFPACLHETNELQLSAVARAYLKVLRKGHTSASRVVDKQLSNSMLLGFAGLLTPNARVIHCTRHPMDLGLSCWTQKFPPGTNGWASSQAAIAANWHRNEELMDHWATVGPLPILTVRYEALVDDLQGEVRRMLDFVSLPFDEACLRFWNTKRTVLTLSQDQVRRPLYASAVGRHKAWGEHLAPLRNALGAAIEHYEQASTPG